MAVPVLLARDATPVDTPALPETSAPAETANSDEALAEPVVAKASTADRSRRRRVLGSRKNPFEPAPVKKPKAKKTTKDDSGKTDSKGDPGVTKPPSTDVPVAPVAPVEPVAQKKPAPPKGSLVVRFGDPASDSLEKKLLRKLEGLPDGTTETGPLVIFTGLTDHGKKAVFLVDASVDRHRRRDLQAAPEQLRDDRARRRRDRVLRRDRPGDGRGHDAVRARPGEDQLDRSATAAPDPRSRGS